MDFQDDLISVSASSFRMPPKEDPTSLKSLDFTVLDVEIAMPKWHTICQLAVCIVKNGKIQETRSWHIQPPNNEYGRIQTGIHGISAKNTEGSKTFDAVWEEIKPLIDGQLIFCHNAQFDIGSLRQTLTHYNIEQPFLWYGCSWRLAQKLMPDLPKHKLNVICEHLSIPLNHHDAASDVKATALVLLAIAEAHKLQHNDDYYKVSRWEWGQMTPITYRPCFERTNNRPSENASGQHEGPIQGDEKVKEIKEKPERVPEHRQVLKGLTLAFTGSFDSFSQEEIKTLAYILGAEVAPTLNKTVNYLIAGVQKAANITGGLSEKERRALKLGIPILSEKTFISRISQN